MIDNKPPSEELDSHAAHSISQVRVKWYFTVSPKSSRICEVPYHRIETKVKTPGLSMTEGEISELTGSERIPFTGLSL